MTRQELEQQCEEFGAKDLPTYHSDDEYIAYSMAWRSCSDLTWPMIEEARTEAERLAEALESIGKIPGGQLDVALRAYRSKFPKGAE